MCTELGCSHCIRSETPNKMKWGRCGGRDHRWNLLLVWSLCHSRDEFDGCEYRIKFITQPITYYRIIIIIIAGQLFRQKLCMRTSKSLFSKCFSFFVCHFSFGSSYRCAKVGATNTDDTAADPNAAMCILHSSRECNKIFALKSKWTHSIIIIISTRKSTHIPFNSVSSPSLLLALSSSSSLRMPSRRRDTSGLATCHRRIFKLDLVTNNGFDAHPADTRDSLKTRWRLFSNSKTVPLIENSWSQKLITPNWR